MDTELDLAWVLTCSALVLLMQAGFVCLELGSVRAKNAVNVAMKNALDFCIAGLAFWAVGFGLMYGDSQWGLFGLGALFPEAETPPDAAFFLFQLVFCGASVTIASGAAAERMAFRAYALLAMVAAIAIYPVIGHWVWGGGWLAQIGFVDFAGSMVVHMTGGAIGLAAATIIGPRLGRFGADGRPRPLRPHALGVAMFGVLILWFGWLGFNGGSALTFDARAPAIILNTVIAPIGAIAFIVIGHFVQKRPPDVPLTITAAIAGLVSITANCHAVGTTDAALIGAVGGALAWWSSLALTHVGVDDPVGATPAHLVAGAWGVIAVGLFGDPASLETGLGRGEQIGVQILGAVVGGATAIAVAAAALFSFSRLSPLRVSRRAELIGLDIAEHGAETAMLRLVGEMERHRSTGDFKTPAHVELGDISGVVSAQYNAVLGRVRSEARRREAAVERLEAAKAEAESASRSKSEFVAKVSHELRTPLNAIVGFSDILKKREARSEDEETEFLGYVHDNATHLSRLIDRLLELGRVQSDRAELNEQHRTLAAIVDSAIAACAYDAQSLSIRVRRIGVGDDAGLWVRGDYELLVRALSNLLHNGLKHAPIGSEVTVEAQAEDDGRLAITILDFGDGVDLDVVESLFDPFAQADPNSEGVGLGLTLTRSFVEMHGGEVTLRSRPGVGTEATIWLPADRVMAMAA